MQKKKRQIGFSLIELMTVIVILGILATLAVPRYNRFIAKSRQTEAKTNLGHIAMLQDAYKVEYEEYVALGNIGGGTCTSAAETNELGFRPSACEKLRYQYSTTTANSTNFTVKGLSNGSGGGYIYPGCSLPDQWFIDEVRTLKVGNGPPGSDPPGVAGNNALIDCDQ